MAESFGEEELVEEYVEDIRQELFDYKASRFEEIVGNEELSEHRMLTKIGNLDNRVEEAQKRIDDIIVAVESCIEFGEDGDVLYGGITKRPSSIEDKLDHSIDYRKTGYIMSFMADLGLIESLNESYSFGNSNIYELQAFRQVVHDDSFAGEYRSFRPSSTISS